VTPLGIFGLFSVMILVFSPLSSFQPSEKIKLRISLSALFFLTASPSRPAFPLFVVVFFLEAGRDHSFLFFPLIFSSPRVNGLFSRRGRPTSWSPTPQPVQRATHFKSPLLFPGKDRSSFSSFLSHTPPDEPP